MGGSDDYRKKHLPRYLTIRRTFLLRIYRVRSRVANRWTETFIFLSCSTLNQKSYTSFLIALSLPLRLLTKILQSSSKITSDIDLPKSRQRQTQQDRRSRMPLSLRLRTSHCRSRLGWAVPNSMLAL